MKSNKTDLTESAVQHVRTHKVVVVSSHYNSGAKHEEMASGPSRQERAGVEGWPANPKGLQLDLFCMHNFHCLEKRQLQIKCALLFKGEDFSKRMCKCSVSVKMDNRDSQIIH